MKKRSLFIFSVMVLIPLILFAQISSGTIYSSVIMSFLRSTTAAAARSAIGAANSGSGGALTNAILYGSTSGNWTVGSTGNLTADTARTVTTTTGALTLSSGSSHIVLSPSSSVGIGTTGPDAKLDVLSTAGSQYRATYTDGSVYSDWGTLSSGITQWTNSLGHRMESSIVNNTAVSSRARQGGLAFDGVTAASDLHTVGTIGTGDFSVRVVFLCPTSYSTFPTLMVASSTGSYTASGALWFLFDSNAGGDLGFNFNNTDNNNRAGYKISNFGASFGGKVVDVLFVRSSGVVTVYANGVSQTLTNANTGTPASWSDSVSAAYFRVGASSATQNLFNSIIYSVQLFTRALSASEVVDLANKGVAEADKWANLTGQTSGTLTRGQRYRITTFVAGDSFTNVGAASNATGVEFVATGTTPTTWTNSSTLNKIGCLIDPDLAVGVGYQAPDRSSNKYHGVISSTGVSHVLDQRRGQIRYTTTGATTGAFQLLSGTAIPSNALIQSIVAWSAGTPLIYVGTATGTSNVVGHTTLTGSTYTPLTLSTQFSTTGNLWINKSATNEVNLTVNYMMVDP